MTLKKVHHNPRPEPREFPKIMIEENDETNELIITCLVDDDVMEIAHHDKTKTKKVSKAKMAALSPEAKRLQIVFNDLGGSDSLGTRDFAKLMETSQTSIVRILNGQGTIPLKIIRIVCYKLGYSVEWFINGTGTKKASKNDTKQLVTEISLLRVDMEIMLNKNISLEARMKAYENEFEDLKKLVQKSV